MSSYDEAGTWMACSSRWFCRMICKANSHRWKAQHFLSIKFKHKIISELYPIKKAFWSVTEYLCHWLQKSSSTSHEITSLFHLKNTVADFIYTVRNASEAGCLGIFEDGLLQLLFLRERFLHSIHTYKKVTENPFAWLQNTLQYMT